jgi:selenocysteine lyase/cysteine desulfurase
MMDTKFWNYVRSEIIGRSTQIDTPFGKRLLTYADYTASGRGVRFIERYLEKIQEHYGNTHTEDDITGSLTTERMHWAEKVIKAHVKAGKEYRIIEAGTGSTGAIHRLQQIIGLYIPPAAKELVSSILFKGISANSLTEVETTLLAARPVVFVGPYEHHSNEISWRECFAEVIEIDLCEDGTLDMADLEKKVSAPAYAGRLKIGSFSAGSNVSGIKTPVYEVARVLKRHDCLVFFDFAAIGPYVDIDMCKSEDTAFDAIFFSPHKFLGGPGSTGILIIHEKIYPKHLPPTCAGGGTVDFVNLTEQEYSTDIETREKPGTPGILQTMKAALALELKDRLGVEEIEKRETDYIRRGLEFFGKIPEIEIVGNLDPSKRVAILSFNITTGDCYLHPRYVVRLLNDLFGIQSRAGCSCAGPYGHRLLKIDNKKSLEFKEQIMLGNMGIKPGWARLNFHYIATEEEFRFILQAVAFAAENGKTFLPLYHFDQNSGGWYPRDWKSNLPQFGLGEALSGTPAETPLSEETMGRLYTVYLEEAKALAEKFRETYKDRKFETTERNLIPFVYCP